jgi:hypothetical protein
MTPCDQQILRSEIDALAASLANCFELLTPNAQAKVLELETHLALLRKRIE